MSTEIVKQLATQVKNQEILVSSKEHPTDDDYRLLRELRLEYSMATSKVSNAKYIH